MGFFAKAVEGIKERLSDNSEKKKEEKEFISRMQLEAEVRRREVFEEEYRKNALIVAQAKAKKDAAELSGIQKLRAMNRVRRLESPDAQNPGMFSKLRAYTQENMARREANLKRTKELQEAARKMREERYNKLKTQPIRKPFDRKQKPSWY